ncbi:MAG: sodium:solute symporter [Gemmatimonadales bacterium]
MLHTRSKSVTAVDFAVMAVYFAVIVAIGGYFARRQAGTSDYFLGGHSLPWWAVMLSIVATETSALTVISIPGVGARGDLTFLQLPLGYLIGRMGVALWLLPGYFRGEQQTAYERLQTRFGLTTRKTASAVFMSIRALGDSVRVFATAIPLAIVTGWSIPVSVLVVVGATLAYTWAGGIKAVVWVDVIQMAVYSIAGVATILVAANMAGGIETVLQSAAPEGKLRAINLTWSFSATYTLAGGVLGGALLSAASHGTDHLIVQRLLATRSLGDARKALVGSGILVIVQFAVFLLVGTFLWAAGADDGAITSDQIFPTFVVQHLPVGLTGLVVAGLLAAAMSTVSSSLNALASAATHDFYAPIAGSKDPKHLLKVGRWATVLWAAVLATGALSFRSTDQPVVVLALSIASITYGALLGTYILGGLVRGARQLHAIVAIAVATVTMLVVVFAKPLAFADLAWPWYVPLGTAITLAVGAGMSRLTPQVVQA